MPMPLLDVDIQIYDYFPWNLYKETHTISSSKPRFSHETPMWVGNEDSDDDNVQQLLMIKSSLSFKEKTEDNLICDLLTNPYSPTNHIMNMMEETCSFSSIQIEFQSYHPIFTLHLKQTTCQ
jgi:hypothetical protein